MHLHRLSLAYALATAAAFLPASVPAQQPPFQAPNIVPISPHLVTSGQPSATALAALGSQGFDAVIYLAPFTVRDAVRDEAAIVERQGIRFVNIPIQFSNPTEQDFETFVSAMSATPNCKVLVHCQVNMRASSMVFLHRVIVGREAPEHAYEAVAQVWSPDGVWKQFMISMLRRHGVPFEPY